MSDFISQLPKVRGEYRENSLLSKVTWFAVGGVADVLFKPADMDDLAFFLKHCPREIPVVTLGVGSNVLVRDGGIRGVVIRLGREFTKISHQGDLLMAGAGALDLNVAVYAQKQGRGGLEFLSGIPGTIGGAVKMNAGAYGLETKDVLKTAVLITRDGDIFEKTSQELGFSYRHSNVKDEIVVSATFITTPDDPVTIKTRMDEIRAKRESTQPIRAKTGGSTFANPDGHKAWELIDSVGGRGLKIGGAQVSEKHCNFLINTGDATAADLETLGETLRSRVKEKHGIDLRWEIIRLGETKKV